MTTETIKERRRRIAKEYYNARKNDPEFLAMRAQRSATNRINTPDTEEAQQKRRVYQRKYYDKSKGTAEWRAKHAAQSKKYRDRMKNDPVWREKQKLAAKKCRENKKLNEQTTTTDSLDSRTSEL